MVAEALLALGRDVSLRLAGCLSGVGSEKGWHRVQGAGMGVLEYTVLRCVPAWERKGSCTGETCTQHSLVVVTPGASMLLPTLLACVRVCGCAGAGCVLCQHLYTVGSVCVWFAWVGPAPHTNLILAGKPSMASLIGGVGYPACGGLCYMGYRHCKTSLLWPAEA